MIRFLARLNLARAVLTCAGLLTFGAEVAFAQSFPQVLSILPPARPDALKDQPVSTAATPQRQALSQSPSQSPSQPLVLSEPSKPVALNEAAIIDRANSYFNTLTSLSSEFTQVVSDGRRLAGKLNLQRPGKLRFDYTSVPVEVIADGTSVAVRDRKLATQDLYPINQTPLKFLVRERIDLRRDVTVKDTSSDPVGVRITVEDRSTLGGTSRIALYFDREMSELQQWRITDPQGGQTTVVLSQIEKGKRLDPKLFVINYDQQIFDRKE